MTFEPYKDPLAVKKIADFVKGSVAWPTYLEVRSSANRELSRIGGRDVRSQSSLKELLEHDEEYYREIFVVETETRSLPIDLLCEMLGDLMTCSNHVEGIVGRDYLDLGLDRDAGFLHRTVVERFDGLKLSAVARYVRYRSSNFDAFAMKDYLRFWRRFDVLTEPEIAELSKWFL